MRPLGASGIRRFGNGREHSSPEVRARPQPVPAGRGEEPAAYFEKRGSRLREAGETRDWGKCKSP